MKESKWSATHFRALSLLLLIGALSNDSLAAPGDVDLSFDAGSGINGVVAAVALQPDGKLIIGGGFTTVKGLVCAGIARLNADGSTDSTFSFPRFTSGFAGASAIALQSDGKILVAQSGVFRLHSDGSRDTNFIAPSLLDYSLNPARVDAIAIQPDGKILVGGFFKIVDGRLQSSIARLHADGSLDTAFVPETSGNEFSFVTSIAVQPDGKVLIGGYYLTLHAAPLARLNADGSLETEGRNVNDSVWAMALQPDGKVLIGGLFTAVNDTNRNGIARLNADLNLDTNFNPGTGANGYRLALQPDGKVLAGGRRLNADGSLDSTFDLGPGPHVIVAIAVQPDGKVLLGGGDNKPDYDRLIRVNANGSRDGTFVAGGGVERGGVGSLTLQPDGKVLIAGGFRFVNGASRNGVARLHADGRLDTTFIPQAGIQGIVRLQPDGKVLVSGYPSNGINFDIVRLDADGSLDSSFDIGTGFEDGGYVRDIALQPDGKVMIAGGFRTVNGTNGAGVARLNANGSLDTTFEFRMTPGFQINALTVQPDGKVLIGGSFQIENDSNLYGFARLNVDGSLDGSFQHGITQGATNWNVLRIALQPDGTVLISGGFNAVHGTQRFRIARLRADGSVDPTFDAGEGTRSAGGAPLALQPDGKILIGGFYDLENGAALVGVFRLHSDGRLDSSFETPQTYIDGLEAMALQPDGNIMIGGGFLDYAQVVRPYVGRLYGDSARPALSIARSNSLSVLSWPAAFGNFQLQENTSLSLANGWSAVGAPHSTNNSFISVALPVVGSRKFFRLSLP